MELKSRIDQDHVLRIRQDRERLAELAAAAMNRLPQLDLEIVHER
jgi:hypothetical protein